MRWSQSECVECGAALRGVGEQSRYGLSSTHQTSDRHSFPAPEVVQPPPAILTTNCHRCADWLGSQPKVHGARGKKSVRKENVMKNGINMLLLVLAGSLALCFGTISCTN